MCNVYITVFLYLNNIVYIIMYTCVLHIVIYYTLIFLLFLFFSLCGSWSWLYDLHKISYVPRASVYVQIVKKDLILSPDCHLFVRW